MAYSRCLPGWYRLAWPTLLIVLAGGCGDSDQDKEQRNERLLQSEGRLRDAERAVYSIILSRSKVVQDETSDPECVLLARNFATLRDFSLVSNTPEEMRQRIFDNMREAKLSTVDDFIRSAQLSGTVQDVSSSLPVRIIGEEEVAGLMEDLIVDAEKSRWAQFPPSAGVITVSRIGFDAKETQCLVYCQRILDGLNGEGGVVLLEKDAENGVWRIVDEMRIWVR